MMLEQTMQLQVGQQHLRLHLWVPRWVLRPSLPVTLLTPTAPPPLLPRLPALLVIYTDTITNTSEDVAKKCQRICFFNKTSYILSSRWMSYPQMTMQVPQRSEEDPRRLHPHQHRRPAGAASKCRCNSPCCCYL